MKNEYVDIHDRVWMDCPLCKQRLPEGMIDVDSDCGWCWDCIDSGLLDKHLEKCATLRDLLSAHDWRYQYADDYDAFMRGRASWGRIAQLGAQLGDDGRAIIEQHRKRYSPHYTPPKQGAR